VPEVHSICVFCGASSGRDPRYAAAAAVTGETLARRGIRLVFGGGRLGLARSPMPRWRPAGRSSA
jgi:predicted Rossmann-fold nucleotide-binding protein